MYNKIIEWKVPEKNKFKIENFTVILENMISLTRCQFLLEYCTIKNFISTFRRRLDINTGPAVYVFSSAHVSLAYQSGLSV